MPGDDDGLFVSFDGAMDHFDPLLSLPQLDLLGAGGDLVVEFLLRHLDRPAGRRAVRPDVEEQFAAGLDKPGPPGFRSGPEVSQGHTGCRISS